MNNKITTEEATIILDLLKKVPAIRTFSMTKAEQGCFRSIGSSISRGDVDLTNFQSDPSFRVAAGTLNMGDFDGVPDSVLTLVGAFVKAR